jgi:hypothetical protein
MRAEQDMTTIIYEALSFLIFIIVMSAICIIVAAAGDGKRP